MSAEVTCARTYHACSVPWGLLYRCRSWAWKRKNKMTVDNFRRVWISVFDSVGCRCSSNSGGGNSMHYSSRRVTWANTWVCESTRQVTADNVFSVVGILSSRIGRLGERTGKSNWLHGVTQRAEVNGVSSWQQYLTAAVVAAAAEQLTMITRAWCTAGIHARAHAHWRGRD